VAFATALFLVVTLDAPPGTPSIPEARPDAPSPREVAVLEELLDWVRGGPRTARFQAFDVDDLATTIRARPRSFDLFRSYAEESQREERLLELPYGRLIRRAAQRYDLDGLLVASVIEAESGFDPLAVSPDGALGLMQVMPETASLFGVSDAREPAVNIEVGTRYLRWLLREFGGDLELALAAYNAGPGNVARFDGVPPFSETRRYVDRVLSLYVDHHQQLWQSSGATSFLF